MNEYRRIAITELRAPTGQFRVVSMDFSGTEPVARLVGDYQNPPLAFRKTDELNRQNLGSTDNPFFRTYDDAGEVVRDCSTVSCGEVIPGGHA